eukprot:TRINITY_DN4023_c0_g1_i7.p1 TRINITY_DN4023_c0_g1~~TRINITY_DN4023_c0_g1_i7.p1  ORF type:complete len:331 (-),score=52.06 TRINITY_DN4023_c0_g1_i7:63-1055(-)
MEINTQEQASTIETQPSQRTPTQIPGKLDWVRKILEGSEQFRTLMEQGKIGVNHLRTATNCPDVECSLIPGLSYDMIVKKGLSALMLDLRVENPKNCPSLKELLYKEIFTPEIEPPTSGEPTPNYIGEPLMLRAPSVKLVSKVLVDSRFIQSVANAKDSAKTNNYAILMIYNLDFTPEKDILDYSFGPVSNWIQEYRYIFYRGKICLLLYINDVANADNVRQFTAMERRLRSTLGSGYDLFWVTDNSSTAMQEKDYYSIILRNIPPDTEKSDLLLLCSSTLNEDQESNRYRLPMMNRVVHVEEPCLVLAQYCSLLVLTSREDAELSLIHI